MKQFEYVIKDENGLHARPCGLMIKEAQKYASELTITANGKTANLKKLFAIMGLGVKQNHSVMITADGADEEQAIGAIETFMKANF